MKKYFYFTLIIMVSGAILPAIVLLFLFGHRIQSAVPEPVLPPENIVPEVRQELPRYLHKASDFDVTLNKQAIFTSESKQILAMVVQHHLAAAPLINRNFSVAADYFFQQKKEVKQIVILSPNHFLVPKKIMTSDGNWQTKYGEVANDQELTDKLINNNLAQIDYQALAKEHGVFDLLPFVEYYFPETKIIPLVIDENITLAEAEKLAQFLADNLNKDSLVILSADFSHYLPKNVADFHDQASIAGLANFDYGFTRQMDIDNPSSLEVLFKYLESRKARRFVLLDNSNSQDLMSEEPLLETTSYVSGYYTLGSKAEINQVTLLTLGDLMLDRNVMSLTQKDGSYDYPFKKLDLFLKGSDYRLANLEGPITDFKSVSNSGNQFKFTFSPSFLAALAKRFEIFSLANNHTQNFGTNGLAQTRNNLKDAEIEFFGDPQNNDKLLSTIIVKNNLKIGLIGYHALVPTKLSVITAEIKALKKQTDWVIVYVHWGNEYREFFSFGQQKMAHDLIDAGADLILGSHPHVIEPLEIYKNKVIFYSLGNFIFDQYFSQAVSQGLSVGIVLDKVKNKTQSEYYLMPFKISKVSQAEVMSLEEAQAVLDKLSKNSTSSIEIKNMIKSGFLALDK